MSNTIRLTSERGDVRYAKSLNYDGQIFAERTSKRWIAHDIDWPDRDDYPRWFLPRGERRPTVEWIGSIVRNAYGIVTFDGPLTDRQLSAIVVAGAVVYAEAETRRYDDDGAVSNYLFVDWTGVKT